jgi:hypothetical protein
MPVARAAVDALAMGLPRDMMTQHGALEAAAEAGITVLRPAALPPADDRLQVSRAMAGMRESRAMAALAADLAAELAVAPSGTAETLRTRLREVVEIGSARDTSGPLAGLYAAARRDPATPLARLLARDGMVDGLVAAEAERDLRTLDERFAARDFALVPPTATLPAVTSPGTLPGAAVTPKGLDITA